MFANALAATRWQTSGGVGTVPYVRTEHQNASQWCWLATSVSVDHEYGGTATQCALADALLTTTSCCAAPFSLTCDQAGRVESALIHLTHHDYTSALGGPPPSLGDVQNALGSGRPPIAQFTFNSGNAHVVLLAGHGTDGAGNDFVRVGDPAVGWNPSDIVWSQAQRYRGGVNWSHVCWTRP